MNIRSATFVKGVIGTDDIFDGVRPQIVFIGRSNVGKSSVINSLVNQKNLARTSSFPGRTQEINVFLINKAFYLIDLPGYGFAKVPEKVREKIQKMINWFLFNSEYNFKKVILIIDAKIGPTEDDMEMLYGLEKEVKDIVIVANKIDKVKVTEYDKQMEKIKNAFNIHKVIPYSAEKKIGVGELTEELLN
ncbi:MAG TPA: YihA family ribosome biogenesis GTP-binding protein [Candidatus Magasanikbacteria bacterium]|nr:YihA family ribosome biogenesis GTP-binding protein [Candidatus Magasanikbacteria bacterium]